MDKRGALDILIRHSYFLTDDQKIQLLGKLPHLTDEETETIGTFLATEKQKSIEQGEQTINKIDELLKLLDKQH